MCNTYKGASILICIKNDLLLVILSQIDIKNNNKNNKKMHNEIVLFTPDLFLRGLGKDGKIGKMFWKVRFLLTTNSFSPSSCDLRRHVKLFDNAKKNKAVLVIN